MLTIIEVDINLLKPAEYNPRQMTEKQALDLEKSIKRFGMVDPLIVNKDNTVIGGHQRLKIAQKMDFKTVPVVYVDLDKEKEKELNLRLNNNLGEWDWDLLANFDIGVLEDVGFDRSELEVKLDLGVEEDDFDAEEEVGKIEEPVSKLGEVYELGRHRLMCGDSTKREDVEKLMNGKLANMVFTDPPYGINLDTDFSDMKGIGVGKKYEKVKGDEISYNPKHIFDFFGYCKEIFLWGADYYAEFIKDRNNGAFIVWDKMSGGEGVNDNYDKMFGSNFELCWSKAKHKRAIARVLWKGIFGLSKEPDKKKFHPTQKPVLLSEWFLKKFSKKEDIVVDLFGGSGSTLIACEQLDRTCYMMELDPKYCDVIRKRYEQYTEPKNT